ncbi:hypothetical protein EDD18DRAFT_1100880 [Armillaria luteobubalina]|uniref:Uncharacterized protein n=1 Tax=Armillaria luteobubalina TaxID=153913 RepID=A0AA39TWL2_9AGAR|nr:hypothetical protein EDD18DRAFT_1100880 [Armillaria luteobubalina]
MLPQSTLIVVNDSATPMNMAKREAPIEEGDSCASKTHIVNSEKDVRALCDRIVELLKEKKELQVKHQQELQTLKEDHCHVMASIEAMHQGAINVLTNGLANQLSGTITNQMETLGADDLCHRYFILRIGLFQITSMEQQLSDTQQAFHSANERADLAETSLVNIHMEFEALQDKLHTIDNFPSMHSYLVDCFGDLVMRLDHMDACLVMNFVITPSSRAQGCEQERKPQHGKFS